MYRGVFDALEQSYLKSLSFCIYKRNTAPSSLKKVTDDDILLECYNFGIQYSDEALTMNGVPMTRDSLKKQAGELRLIVARSVLIYLVCSCFHKVPRRVF